METDKLPKNKIEEIPFIKDKDRIFIVAYVNVNNMEPKDIHDELSRVADSLAFDDSVVTVVLPTTGENRLECINPVLLSEESYRKAEEAVAHISEALHENVSAN